VGLIGKLALFCDDCDVGPPKMNNFYWNLVDNIVFLISGLESKSCKRLISEAVFRVSLLVLQPLFTAASS
jgi:hypothetical protein